MRKHYRRDFAGQSVADWTERWKRTIIEDQVARLERGDHHARAEFDRYFKKGQKILEGGCGIGHIVIYYFKKGFDIVGIDFSAQVIERIKRYDSIIPVQVGDVSQLDFPDSFFDTYYSGGVAEHFEEGPDSVLQEARRVLKPNGVLLISVPFINLFRSAEDLGLQLLCWLKRKSPPSKIRRFGHHLNDEYIIIQKEFVNISRHDFHLYFYHKQEFADRLKKFGFQIIRCKPCDVAYGLRDIDLVEKWLHTRSVNQSGRHFPLPKKQLRVSSSNFVAHLTSDIFKREDTSKVWLRPILRMIQLLFGGSIMFVCRTIK